MVPDRTDFRDLNNMKEPSEDAHKWSNPDMKRAVARLPGVVVDFFKRLESHPDFACSVGRLQMMIYFQGEKVGGLNPKESHWYFSKVFVARHGSPELMREHGFVHIFKDDHHDYWKVDGNGAAKRFEAALTAMTGVQL